MLGLLWFAGAAVAVPVMPAPSDTDPPALRLDGRCIYPPAIGPLQLGEMRILCDAVAVTGAGADTVVEFSRVASGRWFRFSGARTGERIAVTHISSSRGTDSAARGTCRIFYKYERPSAVSCAAQAGAQSFVANLVPPAF